MATIAKMVIAGIVDPTGVKRGLAESLAELQRFKRLASKRIDMELAFPDLKKAEAAQKLLGGLTKAFDQEMAQAREGLFKGAIDSKAFKASGIQSAKDFNKALLAGIDQLRTTGLINPAIHQALVRQLKNAGLDAGTAFGKAASRGAAAHPLLGNLTTTGQRAANTLLNGLNKTFNARISDLREQFANKLITVQQFRKKGQEAANEFDKGLSAGLAKLRAKNQATQDITKALVDSYKLAGTKAANQFQFSLDKQLGENLSRIGSTMTKVITLPVVAATTAAVKLGAGFELSMNRIRAILQPTEQEMEQLATQARKIGLETQFSSRDAAEAQAKLAQQTHSVALTLASMPAVTRLAAAGLIDMSEAADISTKILFGFGLSIDELGPSIDQLVLLSTLARTNIQELGEAFKFVGPNAVRAKQDFSTISAALGTLAQRGLPASLGGTALRGILLSLQNPTKKAAQALKDLKIEVFDSSGKMKDLIAIVKEFEDAERKASSQRGFEERLNAIFKTRAGTGFATLLTAGSEALAKMKAQLEAAGGTAQRVADTQMQGAIGAFRLLQSSLEELAIAVANSGLLKWITDLVRRLAALVNMMASINPGFLKWATYIGLIAATFGPLLFSMGKFITLMATMRAILIAVNGPAALGGLAAALATGGAILIGLGLLAAIFLKVANDAAKAKVAIEEFRSALTKKTVDELEALRKDIETSINFNTKLLAKMQLEQQKMDPFLVGKGFASGPDSKLNRVTDLLKEQRRMLADVDNALVQARKSAEELAKAGKVTTDLPQGDEGSLDLDSGEIDKAKTLLESVTERVKTLIEFTGLLNNKIADQPKLIDGLSKSWALVNFFIAQQGTEIGETTNALLKLREELAEVFKNVDIILPKMTEAEFRRAIGADKPLRLQIVPIIDVTMVHARSPLEKAVEEFEKAANTALSTKLDLDLLGKTKNIAGVKVAAAQYADALSKAKVAESSLAKVILASNLPLAEKEELIKKIAEAMDKLEKKTKKSTKTLQRMATSLQGIADAVRGVLSIAEAFGAVDERAASALNAVADLASSLSNFAQSVATGDVFGAISSAIGSIGSLVKLGQSLFGKSEGEKKREEIFRSNTAALAELKRSIDNWALTVSVIGRAQPVVQATIDAIKNVLSAFGKKGINFDFKNVQFKSIEEFDRQLRAAGSSFEEIQAIAKELNVDLFNEKGRLSAAGLEALTKAMDLQRQKLTEFGKSIDDVRARMELRRNVLNLDTTPVAQLQDSLDLLRQFAPGIANMFVGLDSTTEQGRAQIEAALQELWKMLEAKLVDPKLFGDISMDQLSSIIGTMADALDTFRETTEKAEEAMKDVVSIPSGFKIERYRFQAMMTKAADATQQFSKRVDAVTPSDANPINQLMIALGGLVPKVNDAKLPDLTPLEQLMTTMGTVATSELPQFAAALQSVTESAPTWQDLPDTKPLADAIASAGTVINSELTTLAQRISTVQIPEPTIIPPDLKPLALMVTDFTSAGGSATSALSAFALTVTAAREALAGGAAVPVTPPDMTPLTDVLLSVSTAGLTATSDLNAFSTALRNATAATNAIQATGAAASISPASTTLIPNRLPTQPAPVSQQVNMNLTIIADVQQTQDPEDWYNGVKRIAKDRVRAKYGSTAVTRVEENMP